MVQKEEQFEGRKIYKTSFNDIDDLVQYLKTAKTNQLFINANKLSSHKKGKGDGGDFYEHTSFEKALNSLEYGYDNHLIEFEKSYLKAKNIINKLVGNQKCSFKNDLVGYVPIIPNAIKGLPINMINSDIKPKKKPTCKIIIELSEPAITDSEVIIKTKGTVFAIVELLEQIGIRCEIWCTETSTCGYEITSYSTKIKDYFQPINLYKMQFPIISPDMLRRIHFRTLETDERLTENWPWGYGSPAILSYSSQFCYDYQSKKPSELMKQILEINDNDLYIPNVRSLDIRSDTEIPQIIEKIYNQTGLSKYIEIQPQAQEEIEEVEETIDF